MRVLLVRHGETAWNAEGRQQGRLDIPLSTLGRAQGRALALRLADLPLARALSSPLLRARQTAELLLGERAGMLELDPALVELDHGAWEGRLQAEIEADHPADVRAWREEPQRSRPTDGESFQEVLDRAWPALVAGTRGLGPEEALLLVTHDGVARALLCRVLGLPFARAWSFRQAPTTLNLLEGPELERLAVLRLNDASHLHPLFGEAVHRRV
jgi:phosphoserine phosphatase